MTKLLTLSEVAVRLRRPEATLRYWRATGTGPKSGRLSGRVMYREEDVDQWIDAQFDANQEVRT